MKRTKAIALALSAVAAISAGAYSMSTTAAPTYMTETTYFSNAAHTTEVGYRIRACNGRTFTSGTVTIYKEVSSEPCGIQP
ncbi:MAG: hypothetical protein HY253_11310 [Burkholderiales bacterium]|nr:hypothetical protein [Burkholderiales bacterium]